MPELQTTWVRETPENKEKVIAQFKVPVVNNRQLTAYKADMMMVVMNRTSLKIPHNSDNTYVYQVDTEFDTSANVNSNGEIEGNLSNELTVNVAALPGILRN